MCAEIVAAGAILSGSGPIGNSARTDGPAVKKLQTKAELRAMLEQEIRRYLDAGGQVERVPTGTSGRDPEAGRYTQTSLFNEPRPSRTPIPEVVAAIEARRQAMRNKSPSSRQRKSSADKRQRVIYDDFGEPLRRVWDDKQ